VAQVFGTHKLNKAIADCLSGATIKPARTFGS
jgi:hypothetical protein